VTSRPLHAVFVHGAFTEDSYWRKVIRILPAAGVPASAVPVSVQGFAADVAALRSHLGAHAEQ